jgi:hypothetical protein
MRGYIRNNPQKTIGQSVQNGKLNPMTSKAIRTDPPSTSPNNQDALVLALYMLGGADTDVDVETDRQTDRIEQAPITRQAPTHRIP